MAATFLGSTAGLTARVSSATSSKVLPLLHTPYCGRPFDLSGYGNPPPRQHNKYCGRAFDHSTFMATATLLPGSINKVYFLTHVCKHPPSRPSAECANASKSRRPHPMWSLIYLYYDYRNLALSLLSRPSVHTPQIGKLTHRVALILHRVTYVAICCSRCS